MTFTHFITSLYQCRLNIHCLLACTLLFLACSNSVFAKTIVLAAAQESIPTSYEENAQQKGILVDVINEAFRRIGHSVEILLMPWARCLYEVENGNVDGIFSVYMTPERQTYLTYSNEVLIEQTQAFFVPINSTITFDGNIEKLFNYSISTINATSYGPRLDKVLKNKGFARVEIVQNSKSNLQMLLAGRVDMIPSYRHIVLNTAKTLGLQNAIKQLSPKIESIPSYLAFSQKKDFTQLIEDYDRALKSMKEDGSYDEIFKKYF